MGKKKDQLTLLFQVQKLTISEDLKNELRVGDVLFVSSEKIPRIRRRLGMAKTIGEYNRDLRSKGFPELEIGSAPTWAVVRHSGEMDAAREACTPVVREAVQLLAATQLLRTKRSQRARFGFGPDLAKLDPIFRQFGSGDKQLKYNISMDYYMPPLALDVAAVNDKSKGGYFQSFRKILRSKSLVKPDWQSAIKRAVALAGRSYVTSNHYDAFLYVVMGLEVLLTHRDEKIVDTIAQRLESIFAMRKVSGESYWMDRVKTIYRIRSDYVHEGKTGDLTPQIMYEADELLFNLLAFVCNHTRHVRSKGDLTRLDERIRASRLLGLEPKKHLPRKVTYKRNPLGEVELKRLRREMRLTLGGS